MFDSAQLDQGLLDCIDWLDQWETVTIELPEMVGSQAIDIRALIHDAVYAKLECLILVIDADITQLDHPMVSVKRWNNAQGHPCLSVKTVGDKVAAIGKMMKLTGGYCTANQHTASCY